jgi:hypothetical protein
VIGRVGPADSRCEDGACHDASATAAPIRSVPADRSAGLAVLVCRRGSGQQRRRRRVPNIVHDPAQAGGRTAASTVRLDGGDLTLTVTEFDSRLDVRGLSVGQLNDVRLASRDIDWHGNRFDSATAVLHNVHFRPTAPPVLVAAPVELNLTRLGRLR